MNVKANPASFGLAAFALTTWIAGMIVAGWYSIAGAGLVVALAIAVGGAIQILAGIMAHGRGDTFGATVFLLDGAFWWGLAIVLLTPAVLGGPLVAWVLLLWGVVFFYIWLASLRRGLITMLTFLALWLAFVLVAIGAFAHTSAIVHLGGYAALIAAVLAFYTAAAWLINDCYERTLLPYVDRS